MTSAFNLMDEPWISVRTPDNGVTEVSIREAFHRATEFRGLAGEIPTQEAAVLRLLLAIAIQATARFRSDDEKIDDWGQWWEEGLPLDEIDSYSDRWLNRFNLSTTAPHSCKSPIFTLVTVGIPASRRSSVKFLLTTSFSRREMEREPHR